MGLDVKLRCRSNLAYLDDHPVATSELFLGAGVASVVWVGTIPVIETERLILRSPTNADLNDWSSHIFADPEVIHYLLKRDLTPYQRAERALRVSDENWKAHGYGGWVIRDKSDGQLVGSCDLNSEELIDSADSLELEQL